MSPVARTIATIKLMCVCALDCQIESHKNTHTESLFLSSWLILLFLLLLLFFLNFLVKVSYFLVRHFSLLIQEIEKKHTCSNCNVLKYNGKSITVKTKENMIEIFFMNKKTFSTIS